MSYKQRPIGDMLRRRLIDELARDGARIVRECQAEKDYKDRSGNLRASYAWAVYYHGKIVKMGKGDGFPSRSVKWYGREISADDEVTAAVEPMAADRDGAIVIPGSSASMGLLILAAMPYAAPLENGNNYAHRKFKVVSMAYDKLKMVSGKYGGAQVKQELTKKFSNLWRNG